MRSAISIDVDGQHVTIAGVAPAGLELPFADVDLFMPIGLLDRPADLFVIVVST